MVESIERVMTLHPGRFYLTHYGPVAADQAAVTELIRMIRAHEHLGRLYGDDPKRFRTEIGRLIESAYQEYGGELQLPSGVALQDFLREDIELNAQGIEIWLARQQRSR
jgi:hydroxyacylglutathione hydrolase